MAAGIEIQSAIAPSLGSVQTDEAAMRRLLQSVIGIACVAQPEPGTVRVMASAAADAVEVAVHAPEAALPEVDIGKMMRPFDENSGAGAYPHASGFGVELALASTLSAAIGSILSISSPPEGGALFVLSIPRTGDLP